MLKKLKSYHIVIVVLALLLLISIGVNRDSHSYEPITIGPIIDTVPQMDSERIPKTICMAIPKGATYGWPLTIATGLRGCAVEDNEGMVISRAYGETTVIRKIYIGSIVINVLLSLIVASGLGMVVMKMIRKK